MKISIVRKSVPVELEVAVDQSVQIAVKEMTGAQRDAYFNKANTKTKVDPASNQVVGLKDYEGLFSTLLAFCLYDKDDKLIPESKIQEWPDSAQRALWEIAKDLNGLDKDKAGDQEKN